jgi:Ca2+-binding RTX toxin-like protein
LRRSGQEAPAEEAFSQREVGKMRRTTLFAVVALATMMVPVADVRARTPRCFGDRATIVGTNRADVIRGTAKADVIVARGGADTVNGRGGNDLICGGSGKDRISGGGGNEDFLLGEGGGDELQGGGGFDVLLGGPGNDLLSGGSGRFDIISYFQAPAAVVIDLSAGTATGEGSDTLQGIEEAEGSEFDDTITGDSGQNFLQGIGGDDTIDGGGGEDDWVQYFFAPGSVTVNLTTGTATGDGADTLIEIEFVNGSPFDDSITGDAGNNILAGLGGNDVITGMAGDDILAGWGGDDSLDGGVGTDELFGGTGADTCTNGETVNTCEA